MRMSMIDIKAMLAAVLAADRIFRPTMANL